MQRFLMFFFFFWLVFSRGKIRVLFFYNVALISDVQESHSVIYIYSFSDFFPL